MTKIASAVLLLLFLVSSSTAEIKTITITSDSRHLILFETFRFTYPGHVSIAVSSVFVAASSPPPDPSSQGFFLITKESLLHVLTGIKHNPNFCFLDSPYTQNLFTFRDLSPPPAASFNRTFPVTISNSYSLYFANCAAGSSVTMAVHTEFYNLNRNGSPNYLSFGQTHLPAVFFLFSIAYFSFLAFWLYLCHVTKHYLHRIHLFIALLLLMKALSLLFSAVDMYVVQVSGISRGWDVLFFIFHTIRVVLFFIVVVLVGTRWTFLHPFARGRGKKVIFVVIPLQVMASVALAVVHKTGPYIKDWFIWNLVFLLLDFGSCFLIFFLVVWSLRTLGEITPIAQGKAAMELHEFSVIMMRWFYKVVIGYLLLTRVVLVPLRIIVAYDDKYEWVSYLVEETFSFVFCGVMFYVFRLLHNNAISDEKEEECEIDIKQQE
ncbi:protein GPR107-like [Vigna unguiculata]|uniref:Lung seven transmembrane receptor-like n=1 Tax=Vigna unguiculata TaxID=3917 RepID=A0A4D6LXW8_VIGUN|nr:protein GPR107-like [Vigna unguiculata]QCD93742.1 Lung seven transmembrane receptor-like [Vigna unguiculata]